MKIIRTLGLPLLLLLMGCASISAFNKLDVFEEVHRAYRLALRGGDFKAAALVLDPAFQTDTIDYDQYKNFKVSRYKTIKSKSSDGGYEIRQEVEIQYYHLKSPVVKTLLDNQVWRYQYEQKNWLLQTGLPKFK